MSLAQLRRNDGSGLENLSTAECAEGQCAPRLARCPRERASPRPTRADYVYWETVTTRWADIDVYGHMNNARYFELIDTVVNNQLVHGTGVDIRDLPAIGVVAEVSCRYFAEIGYPDPVDVGVAAEKVGRSSVVYRVGLFQGDVGRGGRRGPVRARVRRQQRPRAPGDADAGRDPGRRGAAAAPRRSGVTDAAAPRLGMSGTGVPRWKHLLGKDPAVLLIGLAMLVILVLAGLVVMYVAFPHRGEDVPGAAWLGDAMSKANDKLPKIQDGDLDEGLARPRGTTEAS